MEKLLPCPFCGGAADVYHDRGQPGYDPFFVAYCEQCEARGPEKDKREGAVKGWNRRADAGAAGVADAGRPHGRRR